MTDSPPKSCIPSRANIKINKKSKNKRLIIERILFNSDITKFLSEAQYLVTLKIRNRRSDLSTDMPNDWSGFIAVKTTSNTLPTITFIKI